MVLPDSWGHHASPAVGASQDAGPQAGLVPLLLAGALLAGPGPRQGKPNCTVYRADRSIHLLLYLFRRINRKMTIHLLLYLVKEMLKHQQAFRAAMGPVCTSRLRLVNLIR